MLMLDRISCGLVWYRVKSYTYRVEVRFGLINSDTNRIRWIVFFSINIGYVSFLPHVQIGENNVIYLISDHMSTLSRIQIKFGLPQFKSTYGSDIHVGMDRFCISEPLILGYDLLNLYFIGPYINQPSLFTSPKKKIRKQ